MTKNKATLYNKVYNDIISKIKNGELKVGDKLPTEMELTKLYGVSRITISRALRELADINLIYRVKKGGTFVNGKLNYKSAPLIIPVIVPFEENFNDIMKGIQKRALSNNIFTPFYNTKNNINREREYLNEILKNNLDGLIVYPCSSLDNIDVYAEILAREIPIVCLDRNIRGLETPLVTTTNAKSMRQIVDILASLGHKKIGFFSISEQMAVTETERFNGFCQGLIRNKLPLKREYIFDMSDIHKREINLTPDRQQKLFNEYVEKGLNDYLSCGDKPTAICCINDSTLENVRKIAHKLGIRIPEDLTVTGFDCIDPEKAKRTGFISVSQNFYGLGSTAMDLMLQILDGRPYRMLETVDGILISPFE